MPHALAETITSPTESGAAAAIRADALRAEAWAGEPFLRAEDDPEVVLALGTARRRALDDALAEIDAKLNEPSSAWKVRYALLLGLERVLSEKPPRLASGTELRRHQVDALAGMLTELIAAAQKTTENGNGNGDEPPIRARSAAIASATRRPPGRRSPRRASSRPLAPKAS